MTRIALDTPSASQRLALRRWLEARGHEVCAVDDPSVDLVLGEGSTTSSAPLRPLPFVDDPGQGRIDFDRLDRLVEEFAMDRRQLIPLDGPDPARLVDRSAAMRELDGRIARLADVDLPVLITGESGAGKEIVARELHRRGPRHDQPFVAVNCAAIPEGLFESELFGHERGSFTDAAALRRGHFERAAAGTLFLDEIGELPATVQAKLLRALQERRIYRLGAEEPIELSARVLSATARELETSPDFRPDLYHRIAGARLRVPPLRERADDLPELCRLLLTRSKDHALTAIDTRVIARLATLEWPGNVRQLENLLGQAAIFAPGPVLDLAALEPCLRAEEGSGGTWFQEALRAFVAARRAAGHSPAEVREELLERLAGVESLLGDGPDQGAAPKAPET